MLSTKLVWLAAAALIGFASDWCVTVGHCDAATIVMRFR
jgi:hypothetical protein